MIHSLKEPSGPDWLHYLGQIAQMDPRVASEERISDCYRKIYDSHVIRVENYLFGGKPLMEHSPDGWKALVPDHHKLRVALELVSGHSPRSIGDLDLNDLARSGRMLLSARRKARAKIAEKARAAGERN